MECVAKPFGAAFEVLKDEYENSNKDAAIKAQKITDLLIRAYAPKELFDDEKLEKYANNSVIKSDMMLNAANLGLTNKEFEQLGKDLAAELSKEKVENIKLDDDLGNDQKAPKIKDIEQPNKIKSID
jgi:hypothetical protein